LIRHIFIPYPRVVRSGPNHRAGISRFVVWLVADRVQRLLPALSGEISETLAGKTERTARRVYTTIYELDSPDAIATPKFRAMRGWYQFAPDVRSRTQVIAPIQRRSGGQQRQLISAAPRLASKPVLRPCKMGNRDQRSRDYA
jgi:hypothetical protein